LSEELGATIEDRLKPLIGQPLSDMWRVSALGWQIIEFGVQRPAVNRHGQQITRGDWSIHISCAWRISDPMGRVILSEECPEGDPADGLFASVRAGALIVQAVRGSETGAVQFDLSLGYCLRVDPSGDLTEEQWRLLPPDKGAEHYVVGGEDALAEE
jgi:hypothetical protein